MDAHQIKEKLFGYETLSETEYRTIYHYSITHNEHFWSMMSDQLDWFKKPSNIKNISTQETVSINWYEDGILNNCYNCVDRHALKTPHKTAFIYEGNYPDETKKISYGQLLTKVSQLANALKARGVQKGDHVIIYMPMIPEAAMAMLACARIGAVHSVVFGGFSPEALKQRIMDCDAKIILTANEGVRGHKKIPLKENVDRALDGLNNIHTVLVYQRTLNYTNLTEGRDIVWQDFVAEQPHQCTPEPMKAEDPLFILYTSGSTGKPKGIVHSCGGYLVYAALTFKTVFDYKPNDIFWCTADVGWITGHSYCVYGALACGATSLLFEGVPNFPDPSRFWQIIDRHKVSLFYTAPTAIRALLAAGDRYLETTSRQSLRILGSVGEPIDAQAWQWYFEKIGHGKCPIMDTWWQTETGGHMITPHASFNLKPGSAMHPFFGVQPFLIDENGNIVNDSGSGKLCFSLSWPGGARTIYNDHACFTKTYFSDSKGLYFSGDGAQRDREGNYWITGRMDDVLNVSGHRLGTAEIEDSLNTHIDVAESAVVGVPHPIKGEAIYAFIILKEGSQKTDINLLEKDLTDIVRTKIGAIATPDSYLCVSDLPKTRSGKIMRRILRSIAVNKFDQLGDISTLANPHIIENLIEVKKSKTIY